MNELQRQTLRHPWRRVVSRAWPVGLLKTRVDVMDCGHHQVALRSDPVTKGHHCRQCPIKPKEVSHA